MGRWGTKIDGSHVDWGRGKAEKGGFRVDGGLAEVNGAWVDGGLK